MLMAVNTMNEFGNIFNAAAASAVVCEPHAEISGKFLFLNNKTNHIATNIQTQAESEGGRERERTRRGRVKNYQIGYYIPLLMFEYKI